MSGARIMATLTDSERALINMGFFFLIIIFVTPSKPEQMTSDDRRNLVGITAVSGPHLNNIYILSGLFRQTAVNYDLPE